RIKACALLSRSDIGIEAVARACGYQHADAFRAWFRRQFGMAPARWRQRQSAMLGDGELPGHRQPD
ncbi:MAG: helix-turn-helix domain-containing protein, partial [Verrucomicrobiota bacterium]